MHATRSHRDARRLAREAGVDLPPLRRRRSIYSAGAGTRFCRAGAIALRGCLVALAMLGARTDDAVAEAALAGVMHEISVALTIDERFRASLVSDASFAAELRLTLQISDHAPDSDFFGVAVIDFSFDAAKLRTAQQVAWQDRQCHRNRGLPKVSVHSLDGTVRRDGTTSLIAAVPRRLGKHLAADEIIVQKVHNDGVAGAEGLSFTAKTKSSGLIAEITLVSRACRLVR